MSERIFNDRSILLVKGNILDQDVDIIVNAANPELAPGGGVCGAIHKAGGPAIYDEIKKSYPRGCETGKCVITGAGNMGFSHVLHAVGPRWTDGTKGEEKLLKSVYHNCMETAVELQANAIAFPAISSGIYGYPKADAARVALETVREHLMGDSSIDSVLFVLFDDAMFDVFDQALQALPA